MSSCVRAVEVGTCKSKAMKASSCCARPSRHPRRFAGATAAVFSMAMLQFLGAASSFEYGEAIEVLVSADDSLTLTFEGDPADALAISFQQCSGSRYMLLDIEYDGESLRDISSVTSTTCHRVVGAGASTDDTALDYENVCAFKRSGTVGLGYTEESTSLRSANGTVVNGTAVSSFISADPSLLTVTLTNEGVLPASAQLVMFSTTLSSTNAGASIDRVQIEQDQLENTFTINADFQASGTGEENFCVDELGCAVYVYYLDMEELEDDIFGTSCQAREGTKIYEGFTSGDEVNVGVTTVTVTTTTLTTTDANSAAILQAVTAFDFEACVELPKETTGTYRVYMIVSPDTSTYARVGYGLQDQLIYASSDIVLNEDMSESCPEIVVEEDDDISGAARVNITPMKASGMMAIALAAAAPPFNFFR